MSLVKEAAACALCAIQVKCPYPVANQEATGGQKKQIDRGKRAGEKCVNWQQVTLRCPDEWSWKSYQRPSLSISLRPNPLPPPPPPHYPHCLSLPLSHTIPHPMPSLKPYKLTHSPTYYTTVKSTHSPPPLPNPQSHPPLRPSLPSECIWIKQGYGGQIAQLRGLDPNSKVGKS